MKSEYRLQLEVRMVPKRLTDEVRRSISIGSIVPLVCFVAACASHRPVASPPSLDVLRLNPGDAIRLAVQDEPELAGEFPVGADGAVLLPFVGLVRVVGEPFDAVEANVRRAYEQDLIAPVIVLEPLVRIGVSGEVRGPGLFVVDPTFTWSDVLAQAGGMLPTAARDRLVLLRDGREYELLRSGATTWPVFPIRSGDRLVVPRQSWFRDNLPILIGSTTSLLVAAATTLLLR